MPGKGIRARWGSRGLQHPSCPSSSHSILAEELRSSCTHFLVPHYSPRHLQAAGSGDGGPGTHCRSGDVDIPQATEALGSRGAPHSPDWGSIRPGSSLLARSHPSSSRPHLCLVPPGHCLQTPKCSPNWSQHRSHKPAPPTLLSDCPTPILTQARDTGQHPSSFCPSSHQGHPLLSTQQLFAHFSLFLTLRLLPGLHPQPPLTTSSLPKVPGAFAQAQMPSALKPSWLPSPTAAVPDLSPKILEGARVSELSIF